jgi:hypothetical protein
MGNGVLTLLPPALSAPFLPRLRVPARAGLFSLDAVRVSFYGRPMTDAEKLTPADPRDLETALALALTSGRALARSQGAVTMSKIVAERLVAQLRESGFVVMRRPIEGGHSSLNLPPGWPHTPRENLK